MSLTKCQGHLDTFDGHSIVGWATAENARYCPIDVLLDGQLIGTTLADQYRPDLKEAGIGDGSCAFYFELDSALYSGKKQRLSVRPSGSDQDLTGSPIEIIGEPSSNDTQPVSGLLIKNPTFAGVIRQSGNLTAGQHLLAPGIWLEGSGEVIGISSFSTGHFDGFQFSKLGSIATGIRLRSPVNNNHLRLCFELLVPDFFIVSAVTAAFALRKKGPEPNVVFSIGLLDAERELTTLWSTRIQRLTEGLQELSLPIPASAFSLLRLQGASAQKAVAAFDIAGRTDLVLSGLHFELGQDKEEDQRIVDGRFEDNFVAEQWEDAASARLADDTSMERNREWSVLSRLDVPEIIVPVFNATQTVLDCLLAIQAKTNIPHLMTIVDDGSFADTSEALHRAMGHDPWCRLLTAARNEGYTTAINKAVKTAAGSSLVILNSDTLVTDGWLEGLLECLYSDDSTGVVGPLSNAATWQSIPKIKDESGWAINHLPADGKPDDMARLVKRLSQKGFPEVAVLNGFCIAVRREVFDQVGLFDEISFPIGYGEENDFCFRAADAGFKLRVADHVYVYHHKSKSFGNERRETLARQAHEVLIRRYGDGRMNQVKATMETCETLNEIRDKLNRLGEVPAT